MKVIFNVSFSICFIIMAMILLCGCKTRKVDLQKSTVSQSSTTQQESNVKATDSSTVTTNTSGTKESHTEAKNASKSETEIEADSIVKTEVPGKGIKTVIYPKKGTKVKVTASDSSSNSNQAFEKWLQNQIETDKANIEENNSFNHTTKKDSSGTKKSTDAQGSGTTWAQWIPVCICIAVIAGLILLFLYFKRK